MRGRVGWGCLGLLLCLLAGSAAAAPHRVASLNLCTDELLVALADRGDIVSLSPLAHDPDLSTVADVAATLPDNNKSTEEIVREGTDLVLTEADPTDVTAALLQRLGVRVEMVDVVDRLAAVAPTVRRIAAWLGREERGEALIAKMTATLKAIPVPQERPRAIFYEPAGWSDGPGTMKDDVLTAAGFVDQASALGIIGYRQLPLETVVANPPDILITETYRPEDVSLAERWADHPALRAVKRRIALPTRFLLCGTPAVADAVAMLAAAQSPNVAAK
ncbi:MAG TPA: ABC transporter substrate-binding protein [Stellaceae bacterium]|nr:ABC transporter substrate-binding protein [Stellaceae bacterium]